MSFQAAAYLSKATSRAKSDVANKLVSMFLHETSRKISTLLKLNVADSRYTQAVVAKFGVVCCYCGKLLENDRVAVEHLDGMNRFRAGLHIPGNVILSCKKCNNEKRRDDQLPELKLASSGWESFLSHDSTRCDDNCLTCAYWKAIWPDKEKRINNLETARRRIAEFRNDYSQSIKLGQFVRDSLQRELEIIYREGQAFAATRIKEAINQIGAMLDK